MAMKKLLTVAALLAAGCPYLFAQKLAASKVPAIVRATFVKLYPSTNAKWEVEAGKYEAGFKQDGNTMSVLIDKDGVLAETETGIKVTALPAPVLAYVKAHYTGKAIKEGAKITRADGTVTYEAEVDGKDVIFDASGKFIKETKA